jgi:hypothetical protein
MFLPVTYVITSSMFFGVFGTEIKTRISPSEVISVCAMTSKNLSLDIREVSSELTRLERRLRVEPDPDAAALDELRHAVDTTRLTAWSVSELIRSGNSRQAAMGFVAAERRRRLQQIIKDICKDLEASPLKPNERDSLLESVNSLRNLLIS